MKADPGRAGSFSLLPALGLMLKVFYRPREAIACFSDRIHPGYWLLPVLATTLMFEASYLYAYMANLPPYMHFFANWTGIPGHLYDFLELFILPVFNVITFVAVGLLAHLFSGRRANGLRTALFAVFVFGTVSIPAFFVENIGVYHLPALLNVSQPLLGVIYILYLMEFMHKDSGISRGRALFAGALAMSSGLGLRALFLG